MVEMETAGRWVQNVQVVQAVQIVETARRHIGMIRDGSTDMPLVRSPGTAGSR
jgi:hypothetical protein